jgi:hypothetical protein
MKISELSVKVKTVAISGMIALSVLLSPFIGKGVENTTKALFPGLSTEEQIVTVADVVDQNKVEAEVKLAQLQSTIDAQQVKLAEQQQVIDDQNVKVESAKADVVATNVMVAKNKDCSADVTKYCYADQYTNLVKFENFIQYSVKSCLKSEDWSESKCDDFVRNNYTKYYNGCQNAMHCQ